MIAAFMTAARRWRPALLCAALIAANAAAWVWAFAVFGGRPVLLGTAFLAYAFGLRHAVDADHIAAIDNATRKLIEAGRPATATGLFFSLGHATVVILASLAIALTSARLQKSFAAVEPLASVLGAGLSAAALFILAVANCVILVSVFRLFAAHRRGEDPIDAELRRLLSQRGMLARLLRGAFRLISKSWHMYPLGFLFGLGFDTATEIAVLGVSAAQAAHGLPLPAILVFPALFTAGMALIDSLDAVLMAGAYRWAMVEPLRKLTYNMTITATSVVVATAIGGVELLGVLAGGTGPAGGFRRLIAGINNHFTAIGLTIIILFAIGWAVSAICHRRSAASGTGSLAPRF